MRLDHAMRRARWGACALGFAAAGFFDGILLHQILQWHHLLSALTVGVLGSLRAQVAFDGVFHAVMYLIGMVGVIVLYRHRRALAHPAASRRMHAMFWAGFGSWHVVDAVVSHWVTGIHRIRMDVEHPMVWDLGWVLAFGLVPLMLARHLSRQPARPPSSGTRGGAGVRAWGLMVGAVALAGVLNASPLRAEATDTTVVLRADRSVADLLPVLDASTGIVWSDPTGSVWVLRGPTSAASLYRNGALFVSSSLGGAACGTWFTSSNITRSGEAGQSRS